MTTVHRQCLIAGLALCCVGLIGRAHGAERWFEEVKATATPSQLYTFLYAMP